jgi:hypothetical protein
MKDEFEYKYEILLREVDNLQSGIRNYDTLLFRIKGWAITLMERKITLPACSFCVEGNHESDHRVF